MSNSAFIVFIVLMTIFSPIFHAKTVGSITCGTAKDILKPCLRGVFAQMPDDECCNAIVSANRQAIGTPARQALCECYKDAVKSTPYRKIINFPEICHIPQAVPISPLVDCKRILKIDPNMVELREKEKRTATGTPERTSKCIRRLVEEKDKMNGLNALKYLSTILAVAARTIFETKRGTYWLTVAVTTSTIATLFNTYWDIFRDWGLMNRNSKNPWLRDKLLIPYKSIYFIAMVVNVVLRLAWMQTVLGIREAPFLHRRALVAVNEHLNNVGKYRAFKSVPLPFQEVGGSKSM
ncbi:hypothetical protein Bca52824_055128 [Brassica carinata]|uniref:EXS domain-containing protein n=1 Tax=Brassica carinata TaxID=52824 RepID=A0A8X7RBT7_BRACI|nr:hypothetical protein Bca52824_055128 [Brassica carinata]